MNGAVHTPQRLYFLFLLASGNRQFICLQCLHMFGVIPFEIIEDRNTLKKKTLDHGNQIFRECWISDSWETHSSIYTKIYRHASRGVNSKNCFIILPKCVGVWQKLLSYTQHPIFITFFFCLLQIYSSLFQLFYFTWSDDWSFFDVTYFLF